MLLERPVWFRKEKVSNILAISDPGYLLPHYELLGLLERIKISITASSPSPDCRSHALQEPDPVFAAVNERTPVDFSGH